MPSSSSLQSPDNTSQSQSVSSSEQYFPKNTGEGDFAQATDPVQTEHQRLVTPLRALGFAVFTGSTAALTYLAVAGVPVAFAFGGAVGFGVLSITLLIAIAATKMPDSNKHPSKPVAFLGEFALGFYAIPALVVVIGEGMVTEYQERRAKEQALSGEKSDTPPIEGGGGIAEVLLDVDLETVTSKPIDQAQQKKAEVLAKKAGELASQLEKALKGYSLDFDTKEGVDKIIAALQTYSETQNLDSEVENEEEGRSVIEIFQEYNFTLSSIRTLDPKAKNLQDPATKTLQFIHQFLKNL